MKIITHTEVAQAQFLDLCFPELTGCGDLKVLPFCDTFGQMFLEHFS